MVHLFCPKDNQINGFEMQLNYIWKQGRVNSDLSTTCPNRFSGQNLTLRYPEKFSTGISGHMFKYLADMYKFRPNFELLELAKKGAWKKLRKNVRKVFSVNKRIFLKLRAMLIDKYYLFSTRLIKGRRLLWVHPV